MELVFALREIVAEPLTSPKSEQGADEESKEAEETKSSPLVKRSKSGGDRAGLTKRRKLRVKQRGEDRRALVCRGTLILLKRSFSSVIYITQDTSVLLFIYTYKSRLTEFS